MKKIHVLVQHFGSHILTIRFRFLTRLFQDVAPLGTEITGLVAPPAGVDSPEKVGRAVLGAVRALLEDQALCRVRDGPAHPWHGLEDVATLGTQRSRSPLKDLRDPSRRSHLGEGGSNRPRECGVSSSDA